MRHEKAPHVIEILPTLSVNELELLKYCFENSLKEGSPHKESIEAILYHIDIILEIKSIV